MSMSSEGRIIKQEKTRKQWIKFYNRHTFEEGDTIEYTVTARLYEDGTVDIAVGNFRSPQHPQYVFFLDESNGQENAT